MQRGASFQVDIASAAYRLRRDPDHLTLQIGGYSQAFDHQAEEIHDVTMSNGRVIGIYVAEGGQTMLVGGERIHGKVQVTLMRAVPATVHRVAATLGRWWLAGDDELHALEWHRGPLELVTLDALDLAASQTELGVVDERGLTWFDDNGRVLHRRALGSPTAIAYDTLANAWLVACDDDVLQLADPRAEPVVLARGVGLVTRVRRDLDALYAMRDDGVLVAVTGIRHGPSTQTPQVIATYPAGFSDFDALGELWVQVPGSDDPAPFRRG